LNEDRYDLLEEKDGDVQGNDIQEEREINTYDSPIDPLSLKEIAEGDGQKKRNVWAGIYKLAATAMVILTVIFSASEFFELLVSDVGAGNTLFRRIFGSSVSDGSRDIIELILEQSFGDTAIESKVSAETDKQPPSTATPPQSSSESLPAESPTETAPPAATDPPPQSSPALPDGAHPIVSMDMSLLQYGEGFIYNNTSLAPNVSALASSQLGKIPYSEGPLVLVVHTHGTESFMPDGATFYTDEGELARSDNTDENMIAVGAEFVRVLEQNGIRTLHCTVMHDAESYRESYSRAAETIKRYLEQYPSIRYVFDLHRDSIMKSTEELVSAVTYINGERHAQIMPVIGSGYNGYEGNLVFALRLRRLLNGEYGSLSRPVCLRESQYNQSLSAVSVLLEIGTSGNTLVEAKRAAVLTAKAVSELIKEQIEPTQ